MNTKRALNEDLTGIKNQIEIAIRKTTDPFAAFDADGTLWPHDIGKDFFYYQIRNNLLKISDPQVKFDHVLKTEGKKAALLWLAKIQDGISIGELKHQVKGFLKEKPFRMFLFQKRLIDWLVTQNVQIFIVSSSLKWVLDEALKEYNISLKNIIGVETKIEKGIITNKPILPAPIHRDKVEAFKNRTNGALPLFVAGNTLADQALLEVASDVQLVVTTARSGERNYGSERKLLEIAKVKNWFYQDGMPDLY